MVTLPAVKAKPLIREHRIPTPAGKPYIITLGPDGNLWFVKSLGNAIGRMDLQGNAVAFALPRTGGQSTGDCTRPKRGFLDYGESCQ